MPHLSTPERFVATGVRGCSMVPMLASKTQIPTETCGSRAAIAQDQGDPRPWGQHGHSFQAYDWVELQIEHVRVLSERRTGKEIR